MGQYVGELEEENNINSSSAQLYYFDLFDEVGIPGGEDFPPRQR